MEDDAPIGLDLPGDAFDFEDVTSIFEKAAAGTLVINLWLDVRLITYPFI
jgi:hypothetical protein